MPLQSGNVADSKHKQKTMLTSRIDMQTTPLLKDLSPDDFKTQMGKICKQQFKWFGWKKNSNVTKNILISIFQKRMKSRKKNMIQYLITIFYSLGNVQLVGKVVIASELKENLPSLGPRGKQDIIHL